MRKTQSGFTLIELVIVIVIIGALAVVALPKFIDLGADAKAAALSGVAGALASASVVNYAGRKANAGYGVPIADCADVANAMQGGLPAGYTITAAAIAADASATCTVTQTATSNTASFAAIGI